MMSEVELKLISKNRKAWLAGILWMIISGVIFYLVLGFAQVDGTPAINLAILIILFLTVAIVILSGTILKSPWLLWRNVFVFPFSIIIPVILNEITPRWGYPQGVVSFAIGTFLLLCVLYMAACIVATPVIRLCIGYEVAAQFQGKVHSYVFSCQLSDVPSLLKEQLSLFDISLTTYVSQENYVVLGFRKGPHYFLVYCQRSNEVLTELDLIVYRISRDIIIEAENGDVETFFAALDGIVAKWKEQGKIKEARSESNPKFIEQTRNYLLAKYATPVKFEIKFSRVRLYLTAMKSFPKDHPYAFSVGLAVGSAIIGAVITKLLGR
jgi:hypothetical protein